MDFINLDKNILNLPDEDLLKEISKYENINLIKINGEFLIFELMLNNRKNLLKKLIEEYHIDFTVKDYHENTPLHYVSLRSIPTKNIKMILDIIPDINVKNNGGGTPLHMVCQYNMIKILKLLLGCGERLDINVKNNNGNTPLHKACTNYISFATTSNFKIAKLLLEFEYSECDVSVKNDNGKTPLDIACENRDIKLIELLLKGDAKVECNEEGEYKCLEGIVYPQATIQEMKNLIFTYTSYRFKKPRTSQI